MIALEYCLRDPMISKFFGIERLSSRDCEQYFGQFRNHFCGNETAQTAFSFAIQSAISLKFQFDLGGFFSIAKRDNFGGCHLGYIGKSSNYFYNQTISSSFSCKDIRRIAHNIVSYGTNCSVQLTEESQELISELTTLIQEFPSLRNIRISVGKGKKILPRIIAAHGNKSTNHLNNILYPSLPKSNEVIQEIRKTESQIMQHKFELRQLINENNNIKNISKISPLCEHSIEFSIEKQIIARNKKISN